MIQVYQQIAELVTHADGILIGAGAGMGVDSGLPDFRGNAGFWKAYPPMKKLGLSFYDLANPSWFVDDPQRAWGFYGHRRNLYRETQPHAGFEILKNWSKRIPFGVFVFTSNVDGHFQKAGFDSQRVVECHGSVEFDQCVEPCCQQIWEASTNEILVDLQQFRASGELPHCPVCNGLARPNILMFGDWNWIESRTADQFDRYRFWLQAMANKNLLVVEIGAGTAVPTVRHQCEQVARQLNTELVRINPRESQGMNVISVESPGLAAIAAIDLLLPS